MKRYDILVKCQQTGSKEVQFLRVDSVEVSGSKKVAIAEYLEKKNPSGSPLNYRATLSDRA